MKMPHNWLQKNYPPENDFPEFNEGSSNLLSKVLNQDMYAKYRDILTPTEFSFDQVIQIGVDCPEITNRVNPGCVAGDEECYKVFKDFFDAIIFECCDGYSSDQKHKSNLTWSNTNIVDSKNIICVKMRFSRNFRGICLPAHCTRHERRIVEKLTVEVLSSLKDSMKGRYYGLKNLKEDDEKRLKKIGMMFNLPESDVHLVAGMAKDWPNARGIWYSDDTNLAALVNFEDHFSLVSNEEGGNFRNCFKRLCQAMLYVKNKLKEYDQRFMKGSHLGHICSFPNKLGGFEVTVRVLMPNLLEEENKLNEILREKGLRKEITSDCRNGEFELTNAYGLGLSECEWIQHVTNVIEILIEIERDLSSTII